MKSARHQAILDLIEKHPIDRQEDLLAHLREEGFDVTQATVSRDIRDLQLVKVADDAKQWNGVVGTLSGDDTFFILMRTEDGAAEICKSLQQYVRRG